MRVMHRVIDYLPAHYLDLKSLCVYHLMVRPLNKFVCSCRMSAIPALRISDTVVRAELLDSGTLSDYCQTRKVSSWVLRSEDKLVLDAEVQKSYINRHYESFVSILDAPDWDYCRC